MTASAGSAAPPAGKALLEALGGNDILVNDPSLDTGGSTQSETSVAAFGEILRGGKHTGQFGYDDVLRIASAARGDDHRPRV